MKTPIKILLVLLCFSSFVLSQNCTKKDTVSWSNFQLIIEVPTESHSHLDTYEEGFFQTITCFLDSSILTIHCGAMVNLPLIDLTKYTVTSKLLLDKDVQVLRGYSDSLKDGLKKKKYFREENYFKYGITVMYENVDESKISLYDSILNNVKVINSKRKP